MAQQTVDAGVFQAALLQIAEAMSAAANAAQAAQTLRKLHSRWQRVQQLQLQLQVHREVELVHHQLQASFRLTGASW